MEIMTPEETSKFLLTIGEKPVVFAENVKIGTKYTVEDVSTPTDKTGNKPWQANMSFTATLENTTEVRKNIRRMFGLSRPNRGKFLSGTQVYSRHVHYLKKLKK